MFKKNNLDRYMDRPNITYKGGKYGVLDSFSLADFMAYYYLDSKQKAREENANQPEILLNNDDDTSLL